MYARRRAGDCGARPAASPAARERPDRGRPARSPALRPSDAAPIQRSRDVGRRAVSNPPPSSIAIAGATSPRCVRRAPGARRAPPPPRRVRRAGVRRWRRQRQLMRSGHAGLARSSQPKHERAPARALAARRSGARRFAPRRDVELEVGRAALARPVLGRVEQRLADAARAPLAGRPRGPRPRRDSRSGPSAGPDRRCRGRSALPSPASATSTTASCDSIASRSGDGGAALVPGRRASSRAARTATRRAPRPSSPRRARAALTSNVHGLTLAFRRPRDPGDDDLRNPRDFFKPLAIDAPEPLREIPSSPRG